jgi:hypothetical protein
MRQTFGKVRYRIKWRRYKGKHRRTLGQCTSPKRKNPTIFLNPKIRGKKYMVLVALHEALHALNWHWSEKKVHAQSSALAALLRKLGVRPGKGRAKGR